MAYDAVKNEAGFAKIGDLKVGDKVRVDPGFPCAELRATREVKAHENGQLYISCSEGPCLISSRLKDGVYVGIWKAPVYTKDELITMFKADPYYSTMGMVVGSSALVLHDLLPVAPDLDIAVPSRYFQYHEGETEAVDTPARYKTSGGPVDYLCADFKKGSDTVEIEGVPVATLTSLIHLYNETNREKDIPRRALCLQALSDAVDRKLGRQSLYGHMDAHPKTDES